ncbi:transposase [Enterococcus faecium]|uniref:transposase n=1 Tax=Enterococcus faecium TaxID=1352 RepID=UPI0023F3A434|nr:transposase [Enterococcus faecium]
MKQLDPFVFEWRNRSLEGSEYPFFMCDAPVYESKGKSSYCLKRCIYWYRH